MKGRTTSTWRAATIAVSVAAAFAVVPAAPTAPAAPEKILLATVGPGPTLMLTTMSEATVTRLKAGRYYFVVRDRSNRRNFHLRGPGIDRKTSVPRVHAYPWHLRLRKGVYTYFSDPQRRTMRHTFRVV